MLQSTLVQWVSPTWDFQHFLALPGLVAATLVLLLLASTWWALYMQTTVPQKVNSSPPLLDLPAGHIIQSYFEKQFDFIREGFKITSSSVFQFKLNRHSVIALSGDEGRRIFFGEKGLNLYEGFQVLIGTIPAGLDPHQLNGIYKRISYLQRPDNLQFLIPLLLSDCQHKMDLWGSQGLLNPCSAIHDVTFQMIIRAVTSFDVADNLELVAHLKRYYDIIDSSFKPFCSRFPWLPGPATFRKIWASTAIYRTFKNEIHSRKRSGLRKNDALQQLLNAGESEACVTGFMMGLPIAGARSTGTIGTWLIMFLSTEPEWASAVRKELETLISTYNFPLPRSTSGDAIVQALSAIPLTAWESKTPCLDRCIRETLRIAQPHTAVRKNMGPEFTIGPYIIPSGAFVAYPFTDTFLNPTYYPNPSRWDPGRPVHKEEPYLGWGGGKHVCKGQRLATLTMKLVAAYALMRFNLGLVDEHGVRMQSHPEPDWNDFLTCQPRYKCSIEFTERKDSFTGIGSL